MSRRPAHSSARVADNVWRKIALDVSMLNAITPHALIAVVTEIKIKKRRPAGHLLGFQPRNGFVRNGRADCRPHFTRLDQFDLMTGQDLDCQRQSAARRSSVSLMIVSERLLISINAAR